MCGVAGTRERREEYKLVGVCNDYGSLRTNGTTPNRIRPRAKEMITMQRQPAV